MATATDRIAELAQDLEAAWTARRPIEPLSESAGLELRDAYAVQSAWTALRVAAGETIDGRKIGLSSPAMQEQMGVDEPDFGSLWGSRAVAVVGGHGEIPADLFLAPRIEGEIALLMGRPVGSATTTPQEILAATEAIAPALEIVDSRIADWRITIADTVADNASYGGYAIGPWSAAARDADLRTIGMVLTRNAEVVAEGVGRAALGHPARSAAWLARKLASFGERLEAGHVVLTGSLARAVPFEQGDTCVLEMHGMAPLTVRFT
ncbi:MAG: 2-keto-4-pentenoate hydratase [Solirubrobacteraceae bacterium]|nr:2-keto-4-pentenoate hydratase [Solirubrobacteraceae bacterium]